MLNLESKQGPHLIRTRFKHHCLERQSEKLVVLSGLNTGQSLDPVGARCRMEVVDEWLSRVERQWLPDRRCRLSNEGQFASSG